MFRQWEIDCKKYLVKGENNIEIIFLSAENRFLSDSASYGYPIPGGRWVFARKAAYHLDGIGGAKICNCRYLETSLSENLEKS